MKKIITLSIILLLPIAQVAAKGPWPWEKRYGVEREHLKWAREQFESKKEDILDSARAGEITYPQAREKILNERKNILLKTRKQIYNRKVKSMIEQKLDQKLERIYALPENEQIKIYELLLLNLEQKKQNWKITEKKLYIFDIIYQVIKEKKERL